MGWADEPTLHRSLKALDLLAGASAHSIPALEAAWPEDAPISWSEAYENSIARYGQNNLSTDRSMAFLEGLLVGMLRTSNFILSRPRN